MVITDNVNIRAEKYIKQGFSFRWNGESKEIWKVCLTWRWITLGKKSYDDCSKTWWRELWCSRTCWKSPPLLNSFLIVSCLDIPSQVILFKISKSTRKSLIGEMIRKWLDKWEEGSDQNLIFADHSLYWIVPPLLVQSIEVVCYIPKPEKIPGFTWIYFMSYLQLVISISVNNNHESTFALHLLFLCELDQSGLLAPRLPQLPGRIFFNQWK